MCDGRALKLILKNAGWGERVAGAAIIAGTRRISDIAAGVCVECVHVSLLVFMVPLSVERGERRVFANRFLHGCVFVCARAPT